MTRQTRPAAAPERDRPPLRQVLALGGLSMFGPLSMDLYLPGLPELTTDPHTTEATAQLTMSLCMVGLAAGQLIAGPLSDRRGRRGPLLVGVALFAVTSLACAFAPTIEVLLALRLLGGLAGAVGIVVARAMVRDQWEGRAAARVFALLMVVSGAAPVLAPVIGSQLLRVTDWRGVFVVLAGIGLVLLGAAATLRETLPAARRRSGGARETLRALGSVARDRSFLAPASVLALGCCSMFVYIAMGSFVLQGTGYGLSPQVYGVVFAVNATGIVLAGRLSAWLVDRAGPRRLLGAAVAVAFVAALTLVAGVLLTRSVWAVLPPLFVVVAAVGMIMPNATALAMSGQGAAAGAASALLGLGQFLTGALVPPAASVGGVTPLVMAVTIAGTATAAVLAAVPVLRSRDPEPAAQPAVLAQPQTPPGTG
ncbi:multidrug effflux MFS transporter [Pseudonocardia dioxanivorans]|uniref:multidrug effflux MFS transporter n=1 Tax=Pseudonocardia dioxanivorans TaxID=240495 RepID=UPI000CD2154D|nr:multidrug effflux MFS transporter [Pseudonocardia dioxanivorans]